jgi:hypothetical protein
VRTSSAYLERVIGTIRRECLDHVIIVNEAALRRHLKLFLEYYHQSRTQPSSRLPYLISALVARVFMNFGGPQAHERQVGGLHHRYESRAA